MPLPGGPAQDLNGRVLGSGEGGGGCPWNCCAESAVRRKPGLKLPKSYSE